MLGCSLLGFIYCVVFVVVAFGLVFALWWCCVGAMVLPVYLFGLL